MAFSARERRLYIVFFLIAVLTAALLLLTFNYLDGQTLMAWAVNNWDLLVEGRFRDFYADKLLNLRGARQADGMGTPFMLLPQMLWCFPLWVTHYFNGNFDVSGVGCVYWYKLFLLVMTGATAYACFRMVRTLSMASREKGLLGALLVFASPEVLLSVGYSGQDEIVYLAFMMYALEAALCGRERRFLLFSFLSIMCCPIMLVPFLAILLCREKRLLHILWKTALMALPGLFWGAYSAGLEGRSTQGAVWK